MMMDVIQVELINLLMVVIVGCVGLITKHISTFFKNKGVTEKLKNEKEVVGIVVSAIEQIYQAKNGDEKLELAKDKVIKVANEKGLKITEAQVDLLIESAVKEMKANK